jgi:para-nitrobenzyl esterase
MRTEDLSRRAFIANSSLAALGFYARRGFGQGARPAIVRTPSGTLRGELADGVRIFRGVPFAQPPVDQLRFRRPAKVKPWSDERQALKFAAAAIQPGSPKVSQSEDCLYLNVWAPEGKGPFPVFVWVHGGGFTGGTSFGGSIDGAKFADAGIVCISIAYRLGALGFMDVSPLLGAEYAGSANNGLRDLIAALEWVRENVAAFGGDPKQVTVGGQSAGAKLVDILMGVPAAETLFHQVISESGGAERVFTAADAKAFATGFGQAWSKRVAGGPASVRTAGTTALIAAQRDFMEVRPKHFPLRPELDGELIPRLPVETIAKGSTRGKRLLIGTKREESTSFIGPHPTNDPAAKDLGNVPLAKFDEVFAKYKALYPEMSEEQRRIRAVTAEEYWVPSIRAVDAHVAGGGSAWMYLMEYADTKGTEKGYAHHSLEIPMVWDKPSADAAGEVALTKPIHEGWVAFIRGEPPSATGLPVWPSYRSGTRATMILDTQCSVEEKPQEKELRLWDGVL